MERVGEAVAPVDAVAEPARASSRSAGTRDVGREHQRSGGRGRNDGAVDRRVPRRAAPGDVALAAVGRRDAPDVCRYSPGNSGARLSRTPCAPAWRSTEFSNQSTPRLPSARARPRKSIHACEYCARTADRDQLTYVNRSKRHRRARPCMPRRRRGSVRRRSDRRADRGSSARNSDPSAPRRNPDSGFQPCESSVGLPASIHWKSTRRKMRRRSGRRRGRRRSSCGP